MSDLLEKPGVWSGHQPSEARRQSSLLLSLLVTAALFGLGLVIIVSAYQIQPYRHRLDLGQPGDSQHLAGFFEPEAGPAGNFRWSGRSGFISLNYPSAPFEITFKASAYRPDERPVELEVIINGSDMRRFALDSVAREYVLRARLIVTGPQGVDVQFRPLHTFVDTAGRQRELGVAIDWIEIRQAPSRFGPALPPLFVMGWWMLIAGLSWAAGWLAGLSRRGRLVLAGLVFVAVSGLYLWPDTASAMRLEWLKWGAAIWTFMAVLAFGSRLLLRPSNGAGRERIRSIPGPVWLVVSLLLLYTATARGYMSTSPELQQMAATFNFVRQAPAAPLDRLLPDPPAGQVNPRYSADGLAFNLAAWPFYWAGQKLAREMPFTPSEAVGPGGLLALVLLLLNPIVVALTGLALYWAVRAMNYSAYAALGVGLAWGVATPAFGWAGTFNSQLLTALALVAGLAAWLEYRRNSKHVAAGWWLLVSGAGFGLAVMNNIYNLALCLAAVLLWRGNLKFRIGRPGPVAGSAPYFRPAAKTEPAVFSPGISAFADRPAQAALYLRRVRGVWLVWLLPVLAGLLALGWYNVARTGTVIFAGPLDLAGWPGRVVGLAGELLLATPLIWLALAGLPWLKRDRPEYWLAGPALALTHLLVVPLFTGLPPSLAPALALTLLALPPWLERAARPASRLRLPLWLVLLTGSLLQLAGLAGRSPAVLAEDYYRDTTLYFLLAAVQPAAGLVLLGWVVAGGLASFKRY